MRYHCYLAVFPLLLGLLLGCRSQAGPNDFGDAPASAPFDPVKAPDFELTDLDGRRFSLQDFRGRPVFIDFWATWCPPCVVSVPEVNRLAADYDRVEVISISLDHSEEPVRRFAERHKMNNLVALAGDSDVAERYDVQGIPSFVLIDPDGMIIDRWSGYHPAFSTAWRRSLDQLLASSASIH